RPGAATRRVATCGPKSPMMLATRRRARHRFAARHRSRLVQPSASRPEVGLETVQRRAREAFALGGIGPPRAQGWVRALGDQDLVALRHDRELAGHEGRTQTT